MQLHENRRRLRYSLRTGLLVVTVLSVWIGWNARIVHARRDHLAWMRANGWYVSQLTDEQMLSSAKSSWLRRWLGDVEVIVFLSAATATEEQISDTQVLFPEAMPCHYLPQGSAPLDGASMNDTTSNIGHEAQKRL